MLVRTIQILGIVFPPAWLTRLAELAGWWWAVIDRSSAAVLEENLRLVLPDAQPGELRAVARRNLQLYARTLAELALAERGGPDVDVGGEEYIRAGLAAGRGVLLVSAHLGAFDQAAGAFCRRGYTILAVNEDLKPAALYDWYARSRSRLGVEVVPLGHASRRLITQLRGNGIVALVADRAFGEAGICLPFFGRLARFPAGPAALALRTGACFVPAFALRRGDGTIDAFSCPPLAISPTGDHHRDVAALTRSWVKVLEEQVRRAPEQWHMLQPRWESDCA